MTQKGDIFKGHKKMKTVPPNRHGKISHIRKGKRLIKPSKVTKDMEVNRELSKFINQCNEAKIANMACKEGGQLTIIKSDLHASNSTKKSDN